MRYLILATALAMAGWFAGCSSPNTALNYESAVSISYSIPPGVQPGLAYLEPGGLAIRAIGDTAVNFDVISMVSVQNDSNVALRLLAEWALTGDTGASIGPNEGPVIAGFPIIDSGTIDLGIVPPGSTVALDSIPIFALSDSGLRAGQLDYTLQFQVQNGPVLGQNHKNLGSIPLVFRDYNLSIPFSTRWHGIIHTTEASPNSIAVFDGPDDSDWIGDSLFRPSPAYPNPASGAAEVSYTIPAPLDSIRGDLYITPHHVIRSFTSGTKPGTWSVNLQLSGVTPGLYRLIWTAYKNGTTSTSHGDIMVPLP